MNRALGLVLIALAAVCTYIFAASSAAGGMLAPFADLSATGLVFAVLAFVALPAGVFLLVRAADLPRTGGELVGVYKALARKPVSRAWEWALLINGIFAGVLFTVLYLGALGGVDARRLGAIFFVIALELVVSVVLILAFFFKPEKCMPLFVPGVALFAIETVCTILVAVLG